MANSATKAAAETTNNAIRTRKSKDADSEMHFLTFFICRFDTDIFDAVLESGTAMQSSYSSAMFYGRGGGDGRGLGLGPCRGVGVGLGVVVGVGDAVAVAVGVGVTLGVGLGVPPPVTVRVTGTLTRGRTGSLLPTQTVAL